MNGQNLHISYTEFVLLLARRLKALREESGLSQERVANDAWISPWAYAQYEKGCSSPTTPMNPLLKTLVALARTYGMSVAELVDVKDVDAVDAEPVDVNDAGDKTSNINVQPSATEAFADRAYKSFAREFGERLQRFRWERDMSRQDVARSAGISAHAYQFLEKGESNPGTPANPKLKTLIGLANTFGIGLPELLDIDSNISPKSIYDEFARHSAATVV